MLFFVWITKKTTITDEYNNKTNLKMEFDSVTKRLICELLFNEIKHEIII